MSNRPPQSGEGPGEPSDLSDWTKSSNLRGETPVPASERAFTPGTLLAGRYRVVALLGKGGMGEIYRAEDTKLGQTVALKFVRGALSPEALQRLYAEVRIGRQVSHPNLCRLYDVVELEGETFLTMEYVDGEDLGSLLARIGRLAPDKALDLARDLCAGLAAVHDKGVVHRDLKPANIMVDGRGQARLTDFGLAVIRGAPSGGFVAGTPAYMAPEQLAGKEATPRSDLYALGLVLFQMFTGRRFFEAKTMTELAAQHREAKPPRLASVGHRLDPAVERAILLCLEEEEAARPASARAVLAMLPGGDALEAAVAAGETPSPELVAAAGRVGDLAPAPAFACLLAALGGLVLAAHLVDRTALLRQDTLPRTPEWLAERARDVLTRLGHAEAADVAYSFEADGAYLDHLRRDPSPDRWQRLRATSFAPFFFYYRQSPRRLVAANRDGVVRQGDPPSQVSGMAEVVLDPRGRLTELLRGAPTARGVPRPLAAARLVAPPARSGPRRGAAAGGEPQWAAPADSDRKAAWEGPTAWEPDQHVRVEAAAYHGRPVWFAVLRPWSRPDQMGEARAPDRAPRSARWRSSSSPSPCPWEASCSRAETCAGPGRPPGCLPRRPLRLRGLQHRARPPRRPRLELRRRGVGPHQGGGLPLLLGAPGLAALHGPRALCATALAPHADLLEAARGRQPARSPRGVRRAPGLRRGEPRGRPLAHEHVRPGLARDGPR